MLPRTRKVYAGLEGRGCHKLRPRSLPAPSLYRYLEGAEAWYFEVATYYGLPMASMKAAVYHLIRKGVPGFWVSRGGGRLQCITTSYAKGCQASG